MALVAVGCGDTYTVLGPSIVTSGRPGPPTSPGPTAPPSAPPTWSLFMLAPIGTLDDLRDRCHAVGGTYFGTMEEAGGAIFYRVCRVPGAWRVWPDGAAWAEFLVFWW